MRDSTAEQDNWSASVDPTAAQRWPGLARLRSNPPWLHDEVGRRLLERIDWVQLPPVQTWCNGHWPQGGAALHQALAQRWPTVPCYAPCYTPCDTPSLGTDLAENTINSEAAQAGSTPKNAKNALKNTKHWLQQWLGKSRPADAAVAPLPYAPAPQSVQVLVANMLLHSSAHAGQMLQTWHQSLATGGVLFFTCLGPETLRPLQTLYSRLGWPAPMQRLVDMHDIGDALVNTGFATPVMEMEQLTLTYSSAAACLQELRELGRNLQPRRFAALRGRAWRQQLEAEINALRAADGRIHIPIEIIYGHAFKPAPTETSNGERIISLAQLRKNLDAPPN